MGREILSLAFKTRKVNKYSRMPLTFKNPKVEKEYRSIRMRMQLFSYLSLVLVMAALYAVFSGSASLLIVIVPVAIVAFVLLQRYRARMTEIQNSDDVRWDG